MMIVHRQQIAGVRVGMKAASWHNLALGVDTSDVRF